jgi:predicted AAA+ superfamily ATPase
MDQHTFRVLLGLNPWLNEPSRWPFCSDRHFPQDYIPRLTSVSLVPDRISLIIGPRQAGKSTLIWKTISEEVQPYIYINCEEKTLQELCFSPVLFLDEIKKLAPQAQGYFFDESQHLREAGLFLKGLADLRSGKSIIATGSSSFHLHAKTRESLAGRAARHMLLPLSVAELLPKDVAETIQTMEGQSIWEKLMLWGGYPEAVLSKEPQDVLGRLVEAFVLRDASDLYMIKNPQAFRKLLEMSASQIGNLVNYSNFAEVLGVSVNTVSQSSGFCPLL